MTLGSCSTKTCGGQEEGVLCIFILTVCHLGGNGYTGNKSPSLSSLTKVNQNTKVTIPYLETEASKVPWLSSNYRVRGMIRVIEVSKCFVP